MRFFGSIKKPFFIIAVIFVAALFGLFLFRDFNNDIGLVHADSADNVSGWAWSENLGWVSFNSVDCDSNDDGAIDVAACGAGPMNDYGVNIDGLTGDFSGYAWGEFVGWISFNRMTCNGGADSGQGCKIGSDCSSNNCDINGPGAAGNPPEDPYQAGTGPIAHLELSTISPDFEKVLGWAKILNLGNDGWIRLSDSAAPAYGVNVDIIDGAALGTGGFSGWAWNAGGRCDDGTPCGSDPVCSGIGTGICSADLGIGWLSFSADNCDNTGPGGTYINNNPAGCPANGTPYYEYNAGVDPTTINLPPVASELTAPNWFTNDACSMGALVARLAFTYNDFNDTAPGVDAMSAYRIIVMDDDNGVMVHDSGKCACGVLCGKLSYRRQQSLQCGLHRDRKMMTNRVFTVWTVRISIMTRIINGQSRSGTVKTYRRALLNIIPVRIRMPAAWTTVQLIHS